MLCCRYTFIVRPQRVVHRNTVNCVVYKGRLPSPSFQVIKPFPATITTVIDFAAECLRLVWESNVAAEVTTCLLTTKAANLRAGIKAQVRHLTATIDRSCAGCGPHLNCSSTISVCAYSVPMLVPVVSAAIATGREREREGEGAGGRGRDGRKAGLGLG
jgi:hypothetical protein